MTQTTPSTNHEQWREVLAPYALGYRVMLLSQLLRRRFQAVLEPFGLTTSQWVVLCCLWEQDGVPTSNICDRLQQLGGTMTGVLDGMERRGLIQRARDAQDRRIWRVFLTESGSGLQAVLPPLIKDMREDCYSCLSLVEREHLSDLVNRLIDHLSGA